MGPLTSRARHADIFPAKNRVSGGSRGGEPRISGERALSRSGMWMADGESPSRDPRVRRRQTAASFSVISPCRFLGAIEDAGRVAKKCCDCRKPGKIAVIIRHDHRRATSHRCGKCFRIAMCTKADERAQTGR